MKSLGEFYDVFSMFSMIFLSIAHLQVKVTGGFMIMMKKCVLKEVREKGVWENLENRDANCYFQ